MDEHVRGGIRDLDKIPSRILNFNGCYTIPWRCYYAKDLENVMLAGRDISTSKMAYGSTRVMGTCSVGGQAVGTAAAMAVKYRCTPREIGEHIMELQQQLLWADKLSAVSGVWPETVRLPANMNVANSKCCFFLFTYRLLLHQERSDCRQ